MAVEPSSSSLLTPNAIRLQSTFDSFEEFYTSYSAWIQEKHHPFTTHKSHRSKVEHIKYVRIKYSCVHRGTPTYRGTGKRPNQTYLGKNCPAFLSVNYIKSLNKLVVSGLNEEHNHEIGQEIFFTYRQNRKLNEEEISRAHQLFQENAGADLVAKAISQLSGKIVSKKDIYNLQTRLRIAGACNQHRRNRKQHRDIALEEKFLDCRPETDEEQEKEAILTIQATELPPEHPPHFKKTKRKWTEDSSEDSSSLNSTSVVTLTDLSESLLLKSETRATSPDAEPIEVTISTQPPMPLSSHKRTRNKEDNHPLGRRLNLIKLHQQCISEESNYEEPEDLQQSSGLPENDVQVKKKPARIKTAACSVIRFKPKNKRNSKRYALSRRLSLSDVLIGGLVRVAPAIQLNTLAQVCKSWKEKVTAALNSPRPPILTMDHIFLSATSQMEDLLPEMKFGLDSLSFEPRFVLSFISAAFFRPPFGPPDRRINGSSCLKSILPKRSVLCELYGTSIIGSRLGVITENVYQPVMALESNIVAGVSCLLLPNMKHGLPVCIVLDSKRLKDMEDSSQIPSYIEQAFGGSRPPLKSLLIFEHGNPSLTSICRLFNYLTETHPSGFAFAGVEICQSKVDSTIYTSEHTWGPTLIAVGFLGDGILASSLYLSEEELSNGELMTSRLLEWRMRLSTTIFNISEKLIHFCFVFYSENDSSSSPAEFNPNTQFATCFPEVPLIGIQANGKVYGYSMDVTRKDGQLFASQHSCTFCIVSVPSS